MEHYGRKKKGFCELLNQQTSCFYGFGIAFCNAPSSATQLRV